MNRAQRMEQLLGSLDPSLLQIENESDQHSGPPGRETHFKVLVVSDRFENLSRVDRQRLIHDLLKSELESGLHALSQRAVTPQEWSQMNPDLFVSPDCRGGSKASE
jgi:stress-induced morphogen